MAEIILTGTVFKLLETFASKLAGKLFYDYLARKMTDYMKRRRLESAQRRVVDQLLSTLQPLFATQLKEDHSELLVKELIASIQETNLNPKVFAEHAYNPDKVLQWCLKTRPPHPDIETLELGSMYTETLRQAIIRLNDLAPVLPDWERANWEQTFVRLERIEERQKRQTDLITKLRQIPERRTQAFEEHYRRYIRNEYGKIEMRGIRGVAEALSLPLDVAFVELKLTNLSRERLVATEELADLEAAREQIESFGESFCVAEGRSILEIVTGVSRLVIIGDPGSGKSTLLQYIAYRTARGELSEMQSGIPHDLVPFLFTVRSLDFSNPPTPKHFMAHCARQLDTEGSATFVEEVLTEGRALVLLDGLDECEAPSVAEMKKSRPPAERTQWDRVISWVREFLMIHPDNRVVVTSRPSGYAAGLLEDNRFLEMKLLPLGERDRETFVRNWCRASERSQGRRDEATAKAEAEAQAWDLIGRIEKTPSVQLLASTPLMLSVLCIIHQYKGQRLPERRVELLRECIDVLLYEWRASHGLDKSVIGDLDAAQQRALLEPLAWAMLQERKAEFSRDSVEAIFQEHLPEIQQPKERSSEVLVTIRDRTGVLIECRPGVFAFAHLILQEYLAAEEAARRGLDALLSHAEDAAWQEVIPLAVAVAKGSHEIFIRSLLQKGCVPLAGRCAVATERLDPVLRREVVIRLTSLRRGADTSGAGIARLEIGGWEQRIKLDAWRSLSRRSAHRIGNQLFASRGALRTLKALNLLGTAEVTRDLERCLDRIRQIVQEFQMFSRDEQPKLQPTQIGPLVNDVVRRYRSLAQEVDISAEIAGSLPNCYLDRGLIDQVLGELLENAIHHIQRGDRIQVTVKQVTTPQSHVVRMTVEDTGPGVQDEDKVRIFEPFFSTRPGGTGLGPAMVSQSVQSHGGSVRETGSAAKGARFEIDLPVQSMEENSP